METLNPSETKDFTYDWSPRLGDGETVASQVVTFIQTGGTTNPSNSLASPVSRVWLSGGTHGQRVIFTILATTSGGRTLDAALAVDVVDNAIGPALDAPLEGMDILSLKQARADVWNAILAAARGERIKEVWRDGRRVVKDNMSVADLKSTLAMLDLMLAEAEHAAGLTSTPRRTAIGVRYG